MEYRCVCLLRIGVRNDYVKKNILFMSRIVEKTFYQRSSEFKKKEARKKKDSFINRNDI